MTNMMNVKYFRSLVEQVQRAENLSEDLDRALDCYADLRAAAEDYEADKLKNEHEWQVYYLCRLPQTYEMLRARIGYITDLLREQCAQVNNHLLTKEEDYATD